MVSFNEAQREHPCLEFSACRCGYCMQMKWFYLHGTKAGEFVIQLRCGNKCLNDDVSAGKEEYLGTVLVFNWVF